MLPGLNVDVVVKMAPNSGTPSVLPSHALLVQFCKGLSVGSHLLLLLLCSAATVCLLLSTWHWSARVKLEQSFNVGHL